MAEPSPEIQRLLSQEERLKLMRQLMRIVRETGQHVLRMERKQIFDTIEVRHHQFSTVDAEAGSHMHGTVERVMGTFHGVRTDSRDETLHAWDVSGLLPVLDALGFRITDALGKCWQKMSFSEHLALVVTRPALLHKVLDALQSVPCVARSSAPSNPSTVPFPTSTSSG